MVPNPTKLEDLKRKWVDSQQTSFLINKKQRKAKHIICFSDIRKHGLKLWVLGVVARFLIDFGG